MITEASSLTDVAFAVCTALDGAGTIVVLTGGSAATFYAPDAYQSEDIDFVVTLRGATPGEEVLEDLGYRREGDFYRHARSRFPLEFPRGPLMVGNDLIDRWDTIRDARGILHLLSPTDACRDRLAAFLFWNDFAALDQALAVCSARRPEIVLESIATWCDRERHRDKYELFAARLAALGE